MKKITFIFALCLNLSTPLYASEVASYAWSHKEMHSMLGIKVIYGEDNRRDLYQVKSPMHYVIAHSTAGMIPTHALVRNEDKTFSLSYRVTLSQGLNVCPSERFANQMLGPQCSGFLIGPKTLVTAGHCVSDLDEEDCSSVSWVFGFAMSEPGKLNLDKIPSIDVYRCKKIIKAKHHYNSRDEDFAIVELSRSVKGRFPLPFRKKGKISDEARLVVIGHPSMLPLKITNGGRVLLNNNPFQFTTSLDTFQGNSGSAVFNAVTGLLEGILVSGKKDYVLSNPLDKKSCLVVNRCDQFGENCTDQSEMSKMVPGENVTRITSILPYLPSDVQ